MIGRVLVTAIRRHGRWSGPSLWAAVSLAFATLLPTAAAAQSQPPLTYFNEGRGWLGRATTCIAPAQWTADLLLRAPGLPAPIADLCLYRWTLAAPPPLAEIQRLFKVSKANEMTEDVPVLLPMTPPLPSTEEVTLYQGLRTAMRAHLGDASLLPVWPAAPVARVVVVDTAPTGVHGNVHPGASRHGDTLVHLIEDLVCNGSVPHVCAAEVTAELALPWIDRGVRGPSGGHVGSLSDLARAIDRAVQRWQDDLASGTTTPPRLILNLSVGWEHHPRIADCNLNSPDLLGPPARAVVGILQYAASKGALIVAAAGNDSGGPIPRTGLVCPGRYQALAKNANPSQALLVAVSGVDYQDRPLEMVRPSGITGIVGLALGGVAWKVGEPVPPQLIGSSVSTAVVSAISALVWAYQPGRSPSEVTSAVYAGGLEVGAADQCPMLLSTCRARRASVCGALNAAGAALRCTIPTAKPWSCPTLAAQTSALFASYSSIVGKVTTPLPVLPTTIPRMLAPSVQVLPWVFPMPISATCPTCAVALGTVASSPHLLIPTLGQPLHSPVLVVRLASGLQEAVALDAELFDTGPYLFLLPAGWSTIQSAYLTGFDVSLLHSVTEQINVQF
jgi:hypothetical protein